MKEFLEKNSSVPVFVVCEGKNILENLGKTQNKSVNAYVNELKKVLKLFIKMRRFD